MSNSSAAPGMVQAQGCGSNSFRDRISGHSAATRLDPLRLIETTSSPSERAVINSATAPHAAAVMPTDTFTVGARPRADDKTDRRS